MKMVLSVTPLEPVTCSPGWEPACHDKAFESLKALMIDGPFKWAVAEAYYGRRGTINSEWCYMISFAGVTKIGYTGAINPTTRIGSIFASDWDKWYLPKDTKIMAYDCNKFGISAKKLETYLHDLFKSRRSIHAHRNKFMGEFAMRSGSREVFEVPIEEIAQAAYKFINYYRWDKKTETNQ